MKKVTQSSDMGGWNDTQTGVGGGSYPHTAVDGKIHSCRHRWSDLHADRSG